MLSVINESVTTALDDGTIGLLVGHTGWGMPPQHRLAERGPLQHGDSDKGFRLDPRFGSLVFLFPAKTLSDMYDRRDAILDLIGPNRSPTLKWVLPNGTTRHIDVVYSGDMGLDWDVDDWAAQKFAITLKAPDPTFYDPDQVALAFAQAGGSAWNIPWLIPWTMGSAALDESTIINYAGNFLTYPITRIIGPLTNPVIENQTTGEKLDFTGISIGAFHWYEIDCSYGVKTVVDDLGANKIDDLTTDSDLSTFHIAPDPEAPGGANSIHVTGTGANAATKVNMSFYARYLGI